MAYVDLNLIRAALAETLEGSDYTSVQRRIKAATDKPEADAHLSPVGIDKASDPVGPHPSASGKRCGNKGFLAMSFKDYLQLLDWKARQVALGKIPGKTGSTPGDEWNYWFWMLAHLLQ